MNIFHIRNLGWYPEDMDQVYGKNKDMEESIRTMVNMIRYMCCTFFKMVEISKVTEQQVYHNG